MIFLPVLAYLSFLVFFQNFKLKNIMSKKIFLFIFFLSNKYLINWKQKLSLLGITNLKRNSDAIVSSLVNFAQ